MPFGLGVWEVVILLAVLALLFGAKGVPQMARRLGTGLREVKDAVGEVDPRRMLDAGDEDEGEGNDRTRKPGSAGKPGSAAKPDSVEKSDSAGKSDT